MRTGYCDFSLPCVTLSAIVNVVIFAGGKFCENVGKTFQVGVIFMPPP